MRRRGGEEEEKRRRRGGEEEKRRRGEEEEAEEAEEAEELSGVAEIAWDRAVDYCWEVELASTGHALRSVDCRRGSNSCSEFVEKLAEQKDALLSLSGFSRTYILMWGKNTYPRFMRITSKLVGRESRGGNAKGNDGPGFGSEWFPFSPNGRLPPESREKFHGS